MHCSMFKINLFLNSVLFLKLLVYQYVLGVLVYLEIKLSLLIIFYGCTLIIYY
jgi:hypothetical protein